VKSFNEHVENRIDLYNKLVNFITTHMYYYDSQVNEQSNG